MAREWTALGKLLIGAPNHHDDNLRTVTTSRQPSAFQNLNFEGMGRLPLPAV